MQVSGSLQSEVSAFQSRIKRLKDRYARRVAARRGDSVLDHLIEEEKPEIKCVTSVTQGKANTAPLQRLIARVLVDGTAVPLDSSSLHRKLSQPEYALQYEEALKAAAVPSIQPLLREMASGTSPALEVEDFKTSGKTRVMILDCNRQRLLSLADINQSEDPASNDRGPGPGKPPKGWQKLPGTAFPALNSQTRHPLLNRLPSFTGLPGMPGVTPAGMLGIANSGFVLPLRGINHDVQIGPPPSNTSTTDLDTLLKRQSTRARLKTEKGEELLDLIQKPTAKEAATVKRFKTEGGSSVREYCRHLTKDDCCRARGVPFACNNLHFQRLIFAWTDLSLGNCSYLDTCRHMKTCRYVHYHLDDAPGQQLSSGEVVAAVATKQAVPTYLQALPEPQWLKVDVRTFDMSVLGKFGVIMADPPWEIHQDLPYGTMADDEMRKMNIGVLQDDGVIFLWVTGRAMELGRECLDIWGYRRVDELIWVKVNQLQRLIRTGRTGHWLNHSKEHCLVGVKGNPNINRNVDCDVVVGEVRETSRKPDEMYSLLERLSPGTRKLEIFARQHNVKPGWVSLGNQLAGNNIIDFDMKTRFEAVYPNAVAC